MTAKNMDDIQKFAAETKGWLYRGQSNPEWNLATSLERTTKRLGVNPFEYEKVICKQFQRYAYSFLKREIPLDNTIEWLALMQHHGAPTRLLDFSYNFWSALFFATEFADSDCVVWAIDENSLGEKHDDFNKNVSENINEKLHTDNSLYRDSPFFANDRLFAQNGTFVFSLNLSVSFHDLFTANRKVHKKLIVPGKLLPAIREHLFDINCTAKSLFPGLDGFARMFYNFQHSNAR